MKVFAWVVGGLVFLFLLSCLSIHVLPWDAVFALLFGWLMFLNRIVGKAQVDWGMAGSAVVYVVLLGIGGQLFFRWLYRELRGGEAGRGWRVMWTVRGLVVVLLMFATGVAAVGVVHQVTWLAKSPKPMFRPGSPIVLQSRCASNLRHIGQGLLLYVHSNAGAFPPDLSYLVRQADVNPHAMVCPNSTAEVAPAATREEAAASVLKAEHCSYVYLGQGLTSRVPGGVVVAYERVENHDGDGISLLFMDGRAEWFDMPVAERMLAESVEIVRRHREGARPRASAQTGGGEGGAR